jgi:hypothetical protein
LHGWHEGEAAFRFFPKEAEIGTGVADPEDAQASHIREARPDATAYEAARHNAEALGVKIPQVDDINGHVHSLAFFFELMRRRWRPIASRAKPGQAKPRQES